MGLWNNMCKIRVIVILIALNGLICVDSDGHGGKVSGLGQGRHKYNNDPPLKQDSREKNSRPSPPGQPSAHQAPSPPRQSDYHAPSPPPQSGYQAPPPHPGYQSAPAPPPPQSGYQSAPATPPPQSGYQSAPAPPPPQSGYQPAPAPPPPQSGYQSAPAPPPPQYGYQSAPAPPPLQSGYESAPAPPPPPQLGNQAPPPAPQSGYQAPPQPSYEAQLPPRTPPLPQSGYAAPLPPALPQSNYQAVPSPPSGYQSIPLSNPFLQPQSSYSSVPQYGYQGYGQQSSAAIPQEYLPQQSYQAPENPGTPRYKRQGYQPQLNYAGQQQTTYQPPQHQAPPQGPRQQHQQDPQSNQLTNPYQDMLNFFHSKYHDLFKVSPGTIPLNLPSLPDLTTVSKACPKNGFFFGFNPTHMDAVHEVREILLGMNTTGDMLDMALALRKSPDMHPNLWFYALSSLAAKDPDLQGIHRTAPVDAMPDVFINAEVLRRARSQPQRAKRQQQSCIVLDETFGADNGAENALWYFRESIGVNSHHWYYHMMYPFGSQTRESRRGELFYYMHKDLIARYNAERLSNGLARVQTIPLQRGALLDGYMAHLTDSNSGFDWTDRRQNTPFNDINHQNDPALRMNVQINSQILTARDRIFQAIDAGFITTSNGQRFSLANTGGVDMLGDLIQANRFSLNPQFYGVNSANGLHGNGHIAISLESDPNYQLQLPPGVMADPATAMRDTIFYRWHSFMNEIFERHKRTLTPYTPTGGDYPLLWAGVTVSGLSVTPLNGGSVNQLRTFWSQQQFTLSPGLDFNRAQNAPGSPQICAKQLDNQPFSYQILIDKANNVATTRGTVRIFLAPRFDERGNRFDISTQRSQFFVLDSFPVALNPGRNTIVRRSTDSALTITWAQTIGELNDGSTTTPFCGCGWPQNLLLPKGTPSGMAYDLLVMVTNGDQDAVVGQTPVRQTCVSAPIYCGIANQAYPDAKPMGYPFDRLPYSVNGRVVGNLDEYAAGITNMRATTVTITFGG